jgi:desulfoferrodoxin (superoxide reductase-like protein)
LVPVKLKKGRNEETRGELVRAADWRTEQHVPVIECPETGKSGERFDTTTEYHIRWFPKIWKGRVWMFCP